MSADFLPAATSASSGAPWFFAGAEGSPLVVAHRGGAGLAPENTMRAFRNAVELGADVVEFDVRQTSEGFAVAFHDDTLDRLTNEHGDIRDWRWAGLQRSVTVAGSEKIPLLDEVCAQLRGRTRFFVEIKDAEITSETLSVLKQTGWTECAVVGSFSRDVIREVHADGVFPAMQLLKSCEVDAFFCDLEKQEQAGQQPHAGQFQLAGIAVADVSESRVRTLHRHGKAAWVWTANTEDEIQLARACGADAIISDYPDRCLSLLGRRPKVISG